MTQEQLIINVRNAAQATLRLIEQAQAVAAAEAQEWSKLGGATFLEGFDWDTVNVTAVQIGNAMTTLTSLMPDILGAHGTNLYTVKS